MRANTQRHTQLLGEYLLKPFLSAIVLLVFSSLSHAESFVKDGNPCIGGVCVSDDINAIKGIKWEQARLLDKPIATMKVGKSDDALLPKLAPQPRAVVVAAAPYIIFGGFDSEGIAKLSKINGFCEPMSLMGVTGTFRSESGFSTRVIANVEPSADGSTQALRVRMIVRKFPTEFTAQQVAELKKQLKERYSSVKEGFGGDIKKPTWYFKGVERELWLMAPLGDIMRKQDLLRHFPGCGKPLKID